MNSDISAERNTMSIMYFVKDNSSLRATQLWLSSTGTKSRGDSSWAGRGGSSCMLYNLSVNIVWWVGSQGV